MSLGKHYNIHYIKPMMTNCIKPIFFIHKKKRMYRFFGWGINYYFHKHDKSRIFAFYSGLKKNPQLNTFPYYYYTEAHNKFLPIRFKFYSYLLTNSFNFTVTNFENTNKLDTLTNFDNLSMPVKYSDTFNMKYRKSHRFKPVIGERYIDFDYFFSSFSSDWFFGFSMLDRNPFNIHFKNSIVTGSFNFMGNSVLVRSFDELSPLSADRRLIFRRSKMLLKKLLKLPKSLCFRPISLLNNLNLYMVYFLLSQVNKNLEYYLNNLNLYINKIFESIFTYKFKPFVSISKLSVFKPKLKFLVRKFFTRKKTGFITFKAPNCNVIRWRKKPVVFKVSWLHTDYNKPPKYKRGRYARSYARKMFERKFLETVVGRQWESVRWFYEQFFYNIVNIYKFIFFNFNFDIDEDYFLNSEDIEINDEFINYNQDVDDEQKPEVVDANDFIQPEDYHPLLLLADIDLVYDRIKYFYFNLLFTEFKKNRRFIRGK